MTAPLRKEKKKELDRGQQPQGTEERGTGEGKFHRWEEKEDDANVSPINEQPQAFAPECFGLEFTPCAR